MASPVDVNHPPSGGFQNGGYYWDPSAGAARVWYNGSFSAPGVTLDQVQKQSGSSNSSSNSGGDSGSILEQVNAAIANSFQTLQDQVIKKFGDYQAGHPFNIDSVLADKTTQAKEQLDPYYNQILGDYLLGVTRKINRSADDTKDLLNELSSSTTTYDANAQTALEDASQKAKQGFADTGLFGSGEQLATGGKLLQNTNANISDYGRKADVQAKQITNANIRNNQDVTADSTTFQTTQKQDQYTNEQQLASQLTKEAGQQYVQGFQATLPPELQSASGFDILKSLGIYS